MASELSSGAQPSGQEPGRLDRARAYLASRDTPEPDVGAGPAVKAVATDLGDLVRAEIALAKAEVAQTAKEKGTGAGLLVGAGVTLWLFVQGLLITIALVLAIFLPPWAAAGIVTLVLLLVAGALALLGRKKLQSPGGIDTSKENLQEDIAVARQGLGRA